jgi:hypothetical protein
MLVMITCVCVGIAFILLTILMVVIAMYTPFSATDRLLSNSTQFTFGTDTKPHSLSKFKVSSNMPLLKPHIQEEMQTLLAQVIGWLNASKIQYWLVRSTMLAAIRHKSLMPWHDNMSIAVEHKDLAKLVGIRAMIETKGKYTLRSVSDGYHFSQKNFVGFPFVSVFIAKVVDKELVACTPLTELGQCTFTDSHKRRREIYETKDVFPLRKTTLNGIEVNVPHNSEKCLDTLFGKDWRNTVKRTRKGPAFFCNAWTNRLVRKMLFIA